MFNYENFFRFLPYFQSFLIVYYIQRLSIDVYTSLEYYFELKIIVVEQYEGTSENRATDVNGKASFLCSLNNRYVYVYISIYGDIS